MYIDVLARLKNLFFMADCFFLSSFIPFSFGWAVFNLLKFTDNIETDLDCYKAKLS